jgi:hypothetical protein
MAPFLAALAIAEIFAFGQGWQSSNATESKEKSPQRLIFGPARQGLLGLLHCQGQVRRTCRLRREDKAASRVQKPVQRLRAPRQLIQLAFQNFCEAVEQPPAGFALPEIQMPGFVTYSERV